ncbi:MAG: tetratricopeptide repeat protein [Lactobacillales bacterium]|nr:tetratricopeptide repeat protein [Lactobacillales bacterium]
MKNYNEFLKAKELIKEEKINEAESILKRLIKFEPEDVFIKFELARLFVKNDKTKEQGKKMLLELINTDNDNYAIIELAKVEEQDGNYETSKYYLSKLDNNVYQLLELGRVEFKQKNFIKAREYFEKVYNMECKESIYAVDDLMFLNLVEKRYEDAYEMFHIVKEKKAYDSRELRKVEIFLKHKLGLLKVGEYPNTYFCRQLFNYEEEKTIEHIKLHLDENEYKAEHTTYNKAINIELLFRDIKLLIEDMEPYKCGLSDKYIIDYDYIVGEVDGVETNKIEVATFSNSKDIITMFPIISEELVIESKPKVKEIKLESRIDKFNKKYNLG